MTPEIEVARLTQLVSDMTVEQRRLRESLRARIDLTTAINAAWISLYGGEPVTETAQLVLRIEKITEDRNCWLANAKANQREYARLEKLIRANECHQGGDPMTQVSRPAFLRWLDAFVRGFI